MRNFRRSGRHTSPIRPSTVAKCAAGTIRLQFQGACPRDDPLFCRQAFPPCPAAYPARSYATDRPIPSDDAEMPHLADPIPDSGALSLGGCSSAYHSKSQELQTRDRTSLQAKIASNWHIRTCREPHSRPIRSGGGVMPARPCGPDARYECATGAAQTVTRRAYALPLRCDRLRCHSQG